VRLAFGLKGMAWRSVDIPPAMPKPDLLPLTGGYRRTPVMQIGADVYCDTQLILRRLDRLHPEPSLFPNGSEGIATALAWWADKFIFMPALGVMANVIGERIPQAFVTERKAFGFPLAKEDVAPLLHRYLQQASAHLGWLAMMLEDGRPFVLGEPSAVDLAAYCSVWLIRTQGGPEAEALLPLESLWPWYDRVTAIGHGRPQPMSAADAIAVALAAEPLEPDLPPDGDPSGLKAGTEVVVTPDDTGRDPVHGRLLAADIQEIVIRSRHPRVGEVNLHFPRAGYDVVAA
jgi:glutathione S-transferase